MMILIVMCSGDFLDSLAQSSIRLLELSEFFWHSDVIVQLAIGIDDSFFLVYDVYDSPFAAVDICVIYPTLWLASNIFPL